MNAPTLGNYPADHIQVDVLPGKNSKTKPPLWTMQESASISSCVAAMKLHSIGAVVIVSDLREDEVVGIFSERDLVKHFEVLHNGYLWDQPVRAFMTRNLVKVGPGNLHEAPHLMARHNIRHIPVTRMDGVRERLVGLVSMRDLFRGSVDAIAKEATQKPKATKIAGIISNDPHVLALIEKCSGLTKHLLMRAAVSTEDTPSQASRLSELDGLMVDIDDLKPSAWVAILEKRIKAKTTGPLVILFNPFLLEDRLRDDLKEFAERKAIILISKPLCQGLFLEKFLKRIC